MWSALLGVKGKASFRSWLPVYQPILNLLTAYDNIHSSRFGLAEDNMEICSNQVDEAIRIMREVAVWGRNKGFRIWRDEWLTKEELITVDAQPENFYIGKMDGAVVCAFILQRRDSEYWADAKDKAVYLHKLCVRREFAGKNMTHFIVEAIKQLCENEGIRYIRLDTALDEKVVRKIYLKLGFKIVDIYRLPQWTLCCVV